MLLKKAVLSILAGAAVAVFANPVPAVAGDSSSLEVRTANPFKGLGTTAEFARLAKFCAAGTSKGDLVLEARTYAAKGVGSVLNVGTGEHQQTLQIRGLMTEGLVTCMGVVALGSPPAVNGMETNVRCLLHMYGHESLLDSTYQEFVSNIKAAEEQGLKDLKVYMRVPDLTAAKPMITDGATLDWVDADATLSKRVAEKLESLIKSDLGVAPKVVTSPMVPAVRKIGDAGTMEVSGTLTENHVYVDGRLIS